MGSVFGDGGDGLLPELSQVQSTSANLRTLRQLPKIRDMTTKMTIETVLNQSTAEEVLAHLESRYFAHYACVAWIQEVKVLREDRFS